MTDFKKIPKGWTIAKLEEVCEILDGKRKPINSKERANRISGKQQSELYPYYGATGQVGFIDDYLLDGEFVLLGEDGAPFLDSFKNKSYIVKGKVWVNNHAHVLKSYFDNQYLNHYLNIVSYREFVSGTTRLKLNQSAMKEIPVPLAPLNEQKRILAKLEQLLTDLDKGIEYLETTKKQLKVYRQAVLKWAFEGKLTAEWRRVNTVIDSQVIFEAITKDRNDYYSKMKKKSKPLKTFTKEALEELPEEPFGWQWIKIDSVSEFAPHSIKAGPFGSSLKKESYVSEGYKIYGQEQVIAGDAFFGDYFINAQKYNSLISCKVKPFDILISLVGTIGKVLILPENCKEGIINPRLVKISLNQKYYNPKYFKYYFESAFLKTLYKSEAHGATMDVLNLGMIQELPFPLCSINEQTEVIREIESRLSVCDKIEENIESCLQESEALRLSIIKKAFEGKLVQQDPKDEPADKLLERIRVLRQSSTKLTSRAQGKQGNGKSEKKEKEKTSKKKVLVNG